LDYTVATGSPVSLPAQNYQRAAVRRAALGFVKSRGAVGTSPNMLGQGGNSNTTPSTPNPPGYTGNDGAIAIYENIIS
jgi:hypothetical protein